MPVWRTSIPPHSDSGPFPEVPSSSVGSAGRAAVPSPPRLGEIQRVGATYRDRRRSSNSACIARHRSSQTS